MATFELAGRLFEVVGFAPVHEAGYHFECYEISSEGRGQLGSIIVPSDDGPSEIVFRFDPSVSG